MPSYHHPILIVGAGPVGLLLAHLLGRQGLSCVLIDKRRFQPDWSRSIGITPPSLAILKTAGLCPLLLDRGVKVERARVFDDSGEIGALDFSGLPSEYRFILSLPQAETTSIMTEELLAWHNITFCPGVELRELIPKEDGVRAILGLPGAARTLSLDAAWVVGCDGHDSTTRNLAGIPFSHHTYEPTFVMGDYTDRTGWGSEARLFFTPGGSLESFPLPGNLRRWVALRPPGRREEPVSDFLEDAARRICGESLSDGTNTEDTAFAPERLLVDMFWKGHVILAGDAAHVMSPIGGQGMNTGFADADYLAAIFPLLDDPAHQERLLKGYDRNRKEAFSQASDRAACGMWLGTRTGRRASAFRPYFFRLILQSVPTSERLSRHFAMIPSVP
jgi:2-polyprenyl-6-methoxyphenol hydroxylase-like FAD-dependent oxidoreductase